MTSALLPYMVTVTTTTPITPLFLPNPVLFTIRLVSRSNFWKCWLFSVTLDPGKFALKTFVRYIPSRHPPPSVHGTHYVPWSPPPLIPNHHAPPQFLRSASNEKANFERIRICPTLITVGASSSGLEPNNPYREQTRRSQSTTGLKRRTIPDA